MLLVLCTAQAYGTVLYSCLDVWQGVLQPPKAIKKPYKVDSPLGHKRDDPYYWLRDDERKDPEILAHLKVSS